LVYHDRMEAVTAKYGDERALEDLYLGVGLSEVTA
jgi:hypothetical protein